MKNLLLLKLLFPFMFGLNDVEDEGGGGADKDSDGNADKNSDHDAGDDANRSAGNDADADKAAAEIKIQKKEYDRLVGRLGDLEAKERQRAEEAKKKEEQEKVEQGKLKEVLEEKEKTISELSPFKERYLKRLANDNKKILAAIEKADDKIKSRFKIPEAGKELTLDELEYNIAKFDEFNELGILTKAADGETVVVPDNTQSDKTVTVADDSAGKGFNPWQT